MHIMYDEDNNIEFDLYEDPEEIDTKPNIINEYGELQDSDSRTDDYF